MSPPPDTLAPPMAWNFPRANHFINLTYSTILHEYWEHIQSRDANFYSNPGTIEIKIKTVAIQCWSGASNFLLIELATLNNSENFPISAFF